jgi:hypothetical protein
MRKAVLSNLFVVVLLAVGVIAEAQQPKVYRIGVVTAGGAWYEQSAPSLEKTEQYFFGRLAASPKHASRMKIVNPKI